jgi:hypothetical protein
MKNVLLFLLLSGFVFLSCNKPFVKNTYSGFIYYENTPLVHAKF